MCEHTFAKCTIDMSPVEYPPSWAGLSRLFVNYEGSVDMRLGIGFIRETPWDG